MLRAFLVTAILVLTVNQCLAATRLAVGECADGYCKLVHYKTKKVLRDADSNLLRIEKSKRRKAKKFYKIISEADSILRKRGFTRSARIQVVSSFRNEGSTPGGDTTDVVNAYLQQVYSAKVFTGLWDHDQRPISILREFPSYRFDGIFDVQSGRKLKVENILRRARNIPKCYRKGNPLRDCQPLQFSPVSGCRLGKRARRILRTDVFFWKTGILGDSIVLPSKNVGSRIKLGKPIASLADKRKKQKQGKKIRKQSEFRLVKVCPDHPWELDYRRISTSNSKSAPLPKFKQLPSLRSFNGFKLRDSFDLVGGDLSNERGVKSAKTCAARCMKASGCAAFTYDKWNKWCFLKSSVAELRLEPKTVSGIRTSQSVPSRSSAKITVKHYRGKTFPYKGYKTLKRKSFESCKGSCLKENKCVAFSFEKRGGDCRLLHTAGEYFTDAGVDSGIKRQASN